jgi:GAF domain-containing protein
MDTEIKRLELTVNTLLMLTNVVSKRYELRDFLSLVLSKARLLTQSDAGSVYLIDREDEIPYVYFAVSQNNSYPEKSLDHFAVPLNQDSLAGYVAISGETLNIPNVAELDPQAPYRHKRTIDSEIDYISRSILTVPVANSTGDVVGVIQLINRKIDPDVVVAESNIGEVVQPFTDQDVELLRGLASLTAIAIERHQLQSKIYE